MWIHLYEKWLTHDGDSDPVSACRSAPDRKVRGETGLLTSIADKLYDRRGALSRQSSRLPHFSGGVPTVSNRIPTVANGSPPVTEDIPCTTDGFPPLSSDIPAVTDSIPLVANCIPLLTNCIPLLASGFPLYNDVIPVNSTSISDEFGGDSDLTAMFRRFSNIDLGTNQNQNNKLEKGGISIQRMKEAAKGAYGEGDGPKMHEFHVGKDIPKTVKGLVTELKYIKEVALANKTDLAKHGVKDGQIESLSTAADELSQIDADQETAKKKQKAATKDRDNAMEALQKTMRKIQHTARSVFADEPSTLIEFESITRRRGPGGQNNTPPPAGAAA